MNTVTSSDGTVISYERMGKGEGPPIVLVSGAMCDSAVNVPFAEQLESRHPVVNYDRRGRGRSADTVPYAVEREIEDLDAVIEAAGAPAYVVGFSSGGGLVLEAAAHGLPIAKLAVWEPPYGPDDDEQRRQSREYRDDLHRLLAEGRRGDAVERFLSLVGMPPDMIAEMRGAPMWPGMEALATTLTYDAAVMGRDGTVPVDRFAAIAVPTLVLSGGHSPERMRQMGQRVADTVADGRHQVLEGQQHDVAADVLASALDKFFA